MLLLQEMKVARHSPNTSASSFVAKATLPPLPLAAAVLTGHAVGSSGARPLANPNPYHDGYGRN
jgi:hypothetical protein